MHNTKENYLLDDISHITMIIINISIIFACNIVSYLINDKNIE